MTARASLAACVLITGCAASTDTVPTASISVAAQPAPAAASGEPREVTIESFANVAECGRHVATGTRIAVKRCEARSGRGNSATEPARYELLRQDLESLRRQQMYQEQMRQQAAAEALRRTRTGQ